MYCNTWIVMQYTHHNKEVLRYFAKLYFVPALCIIAIFLSCSNSYTGIRFCADTTDFSGVSIDEHLNQSNPIPCCIIPKEDTAVY